MTNSEAPRNVSAGEFSEWVHGEYLRHEQAWDFAERWRVMDEVITWAAQQKAALRNTPAGCLANQNRLLASFADADEAGIAPQGIEAEPGN